MLISAVPRPSRIEGGALSDRRSPDGVAPAPVHSCRNRRVRRRRCAGRSLGGRTPEEVRWEALEALEHEGTGPGARPRMTPSSCCWSRRISSRRTGRSTSGTFLVGWRTRCQGCGVPARPPRQRCGALWQRASCTPRSRHWRGHACPAVRLGNPGHRGRASSELTCWLSRTTHGAPEAIISACGRRDGRLGHRAASGRRCDSGRTP